MPKLPIIPESPRVVYKQNPLVEVVAQVQFPDILKIQEGPPANFQEAIRGNFPLFKMRSERAIAVASGRPASRSATRIYDFYMDDQSYTVSLSQKFLAVSTNTYTSWGDYRPHLEKSLLALFEVYKPSFLTRIGLRYLDLIDREVLGLGSTPWAALIRPSICGAVAEEAFATSVRETNTMTEMDIGEGATARLVAGTAREEDTERVAFLIDADIYNDTRQVSDVGTTLSYFDRFNQEAGNLFRWCIQAPLAEVLGDSKG